MNRIIGYGISEFHGLAGFARIFPYSPYSQIQSRNKTRAQFSDTFASAASATCHSDICQPVFTDRNSNSRL